MDVLEALRFEASALRDAKFPKESMMVRRAAANIIGEAMVEIDNLRAKCGKMTSTLVIIANLDPHNCDLLEAQNYARDALDD